MPCQPVWDALSRAPLALFEQDYGALLDQLAREGVRDLASLRTLLDADPGRAVQCLAHVRILRANATALDLVGATTLEQLQRATDQSIAGRIEQPLAALWGAPSEAMDLRLTSLQGEPRHVRGAWFPPLDVGGRRRSARPLPRRRAARDATRRPPDRVASPSALYSRSSPLRK